MQVTTQIRLLALMAAVASSHAQERDAEAAKRLIELRTKEIVHNFKENKEAQLMTWRLGEELKSSDVFKQTVVAPCPPAPAPAPRGKIPRIAMEGEWEPLVLPEAARLAPIVASKYSLTDNQRALLFEKVTAEFGKPGRPGKFITVVAPACPKRPPKPKGDEPPKDGAGAKK